MPSFPSECQSFVLLRILTDWNPTHVVKDSLHFLVRDIIVTVLHPINFLGLLHKVM